MGAREGVITGYVFKAIREGLGLTQEQMAEALGLDPSTIQGWESGRRGLTNTRAATLVELRHQLHTMGADPGPLSVLDSAMEADFLLRFVIEVDPRHVVDLSRHPLAARVLRRDVVDLLAWPFTQVAPSQLPRASRHGPSAFAPSLSAGERATFFAHLRATVEASIAAHSGSGDLQPHRQMYYLMQWDRDDDSRCWVEEMQRAERRAWRCTQGWTPRWVTARSVAITQARHGDPGPLREFLATGINTDECEGADLNYWAYWVGDLSETQRSDEFMAGGLRRWHGESLLRRFCDGLSPAEPVLDLYAHSTRALLARRPRLLEEHSEVADALAGRVGELLDTDDLYPRTRRKLEDVHFGLELAGATR